MTRKGVYSPEEIAYIKSRYFYDTISEIAKALDRKPNSIIDKVGSMKLHKNALSLPKELKEKIREQAETTIFPIERIAEEFNLSPYKIRKILNTMGVKRKRFGWHKERDLLKGFTYSRNRAIKNRSQLLWAYKNTCWDCKRTYLPNDLAIHHDWSSLPIKTLVLCKDCHKKRHAVVNHKPL